MDAEDWAEEVLRRLDGEVKTHLKSVIRLAVNDALERAANGIMTPAAIRALKEPTTDGVCTCGEDERVARGELSLPHKRGCPKEAE